MFALRRTSHGGIAQLGERLNGIQEVGGSNPPISTMNITEPVIDRLFFIARRNSGAGISCLQCHAERSMKELTFVFCLRGRSTAPQAVRCRRRRTYYSKTAQPKTDNLAGLSVPFVGCSINIGVHSASEVLLYQRGGIAGD